MALRGQASIEFLLILSAVVLVVLAGVMSLSEIMKMQQSAYSSMQGGVENASAGLLTYLSNETFGTGFYPISGGAGEYANASLVSLEIAKKEPYFLYQPSIIQLMAWNNYPAPMKVPKLVISVVNSSGNETTLSLSEEDNITVILSHVLTATFVPSNPGIYNVTAVAQDDNGSVLINPLTNESVVVKTNFTVLDARPPTSGVMKTFNIDREVFAERDSTYTDTFSLPDDAVIYSAVLEITDSHMYANRSAGAQASYHYSQISECVWKNGAPTNIGVVSSSFFSQQGVVEVPEKSFIISASYSKSNIQGGQATVSVNGLPNPLALDAAKPGMNTISLSVTEPPHSCSPPPDPTTGSSYDSFVAGGDATLLIGYYSPSSKTEDPSKGNLMGSLMVNGQNVGPTAVIDISSYLKGGSNTLSFMLLQGSLRYKLVVSYA